MKPEFVFSIFTDSHVFILSIPFFFTNRTKIPFSSLRFLGYLYFMFLFSLSKPKICVCSRLFTQQSNFILNLSTCQTNLKYNEERFFYNLHFLWIWLVEEKNHLTHFLLFKLSQKYLSIVSVLYFFSLFQEMEMELEVNKYCFDMSKKKR